MSRVAGTLKWYARQGSNSSVQEYLICTRRAREIVSENADFKITELDESYRGSLVQRRAVLFQQSPKPVSDCKAVFFYTIHQ